MLSADASLASAGVQDGAELTLICDSQSWLFSGSDDRTMKQWTLDGHLVRDFKAGRAVNSMAVSEVLKERNYIYTGDSMGFVVMWSLETGERVKDWAAAAGF